jgi:exonuclease SbcD
MRFLHTSDWHVGKTVRGRGRSDEHAAVLAEIAEIADREAVDVVLVVGDLFDTAAPSPEAEKIVYDALVALAAGGGRPVVVISGNHDNPRRLAAVAPLLGLAGVRVQTRLAAPVDGGVVRLDAAGATAQLALVPFPSQRYIVRADDLMGLAASEHTQKYDDRVRNVVGALTAGFGPDTVNVVLAHVFATGGVLGGGERSAHTVFDYAVNTSAFPASAHYVALGHLHRQQSLPGACPVWYCGSPLTMDFGEERDDKAVLVVDAEPGVPAEVRSVPLHAGRSFRTVRGSLGELATLAAATAEASDASDAYVRVVVHELVRVGLADEVRALFPEAVEIIVRPPESAGSVSAAADADRSRSGQSAHDLFATYLRERSVEDERLVHLFDELLDQATHDEDDADVGPAGEEAVGAS